MGNAVTLGKNDPDSFMLIDQKIKIFLTINITLG